MQTLLNKSNCCPSTFCVLFELFCFRRELLLSLITWLNSRQKLDTKRTERVLFISEIMKRIMGKKVLDWIARIWLIFTNFLCVICTLFFYTFLSAKNVRYSISTVYFQRFEISWHCLYNQRQKIARSRYYESRNVMHWIFSNRKTTQSSFIC